MKISDQYYFMKKDCSINLGRFPSRHIQEILKPSGSIQMYWTSDTPHLLEKGIPGGILFFSLERHNLYIDKIVIESDCCCKVNVYKKGDKYVMKIKAVMKGGESNG